MVKFVGGPIDGEDYLIHDLPQRYLVVGPVDHPEGPFPPYTEHTYMLGAGPVYYYQGEQK